jgi:hypothetical protein
VPPIPERSPSGTAATGAGPTSEEPPGV